MKYKKNVMLKKGNTSIDPVMLAAINTVDNVWRENGVFEATCTSVIDGKHMKNSRHYDGLAIDVRIRDLPNFNIGEEEAVVPFLTALKLRLEPLGFVVVLELDKLHIHIQFNGKY